VLHCFALLRCTQLPARWYASQIAFAWNEVAPSKDLILTAQQQTVWDKHLKKSTPLRKTAAKDAQLFAQCR
jgi:hypothetical protein